MKTQQKNFCAWIGTCVTKISAYKKTQPSLQLFSLMLFQCQTAATWRPPLFNLTDKISWKLQCIPYYLHPVQAWHDNRLKHPITLLWVRLIQDRKLVLQKYLYQMTMTNIILTETEQRQATKTSLFIPQAKSVRYIQYSLYITFTFFVHLVIILFWESCSLDISNNLIIITVGL